MPQSEMLVMRAPGATADIRVIPADLSKAEESGFEVVGWVRKNGKTEYKPEVSEIDKKRVLRERAEREARARETAAALGREAPTAPVATAEIAELRGIVEQQKAVIDSMTAAIEELREQRANPEPESAKAESKK